MHKIKLANPLPQRIPHCWRIEYSARKADRKVPYFYPIPIHRFPEWHVQSFGTIYVCSINMNLVAQFNQRAAQTMN